MALTDRIAGLNGGLGMKAPVRTVATANVTLSGWQTINSIAIADGDTNTRVLLTAQTTAADNGIWDVKSGTWTRSKDMDGERDIVRGTIVPSTTLTVGQLWMLATADPIVLGTTSLTFELLLSTTYS